MSTLCASEAPLLAIIWAHGAFIGSAVGVLVANLCMRIKRARADQKTTPGDGPEDDDDNQHRRHAP